MGTILFFAAYWLLMRRETRFAMVRYYLVGTLLLSFLLPLVHLSLNNPLSYYNNIAQQNQLSTPEQDVTMVSQQTVEVTTTPNHTTGTQTQVPSTIQQSSNKAAANSHTAYVYAFWIIYGMGCFVSLLLLVIRLLRLRKYLHGLPFNMENGCRVSLLEEGTSAFSFGNHIVVGTNGFSDKEVEQLVGHERVHVRQHHSLDCLLCEVAKAVLWFNPFIWLYERELKRVHEYLADNVMLNSEQGTDYAQLFYHQVSGKVYSQLTNSFDYGIIGKRIGMMAQHRSRHGWLLPLVALPLIAVILLVGCTPESELRGHYEVGSIQLKSDNPAEPTLLCSEFLGLENRIFSFIGDGRVVILDQSVGGENQNCTYFIDDYGLHINDSNGKPWLNMTMETVCCNKDSIVVRLVDADPIDGLKKMLAGLPSYRYRIDTVEVSLSTTEVDGEIVEVSLGKQTDTVFATIVVPCEYDNDHNWNRGNRLLGSTTNGRATFAHQYKTALGKKVEEFGTSWEFEYNKVLADARKRYDTTGFFNPKMEGDRFVLEVTLLKTKK
jgi:beta-lactamase regulating signal transducer with metallopeptidase domain